jgi:hypothetical protein
MGSVTVRSYYYVGPEIMLLSVIEIVVVLSLAVWSTGYIWKLLIYQLLVYQFLVMQQLRNIGWHTAHILATFSGS